jgi:hypothetical protein
MILAAALSTGCSATPSDVPEGARRVSFQPLPADQSEHIFSGIDTTERLVIRDDATWAAVWQRAVGTSEPLAPLPEVDFATELVLAAAMGTRNTTGYSVVIEAVDTMDGDAWVSVTERSPGTGCVTGDALTAPVRFVAVPRYDGETTFIERTAEVDCK